MKSGLGNNKNRIKKNNLKLSSFSKKSTIIYLVLFLISLSLLIFSKDGKIIFGLISLFFLLLTTQIIFIKKNFYTFFLLRSVICILFIFEILFGFLNSQKQINYLWSEERFQVGDKYICESAKLGFEFIPNCNNKRAIEIYKGDTIYDVQYSSNNFSCRVDEKYTVNNQTKSDSLRNKHAIFLGCSYTFGTGLDYHSTFPYLFEINNNEYKSYNFALGGYGPHQICLQFNEGINIINNESVPQDSGFCIYTYIDDHLNRVYGGSQVFLLHNMDRVQ